MRLASALLLLCAASFLSFAAPPSLDIVVNAASFAGPSAAPGSIATIFGSGLAATATAPNGFPLPFTLGGASVYVNGVIAPLLYVSPNQINFQIPWETPLAQVSVVMIVDSTVSNQLSLQIVAAAPDLFAGGILASASGQRANASQGRAVHSGEYITILATGLGAVDRQPASGAAPSETNLSVLKTPPTVTIGGIQTIVSFAGLAPPGPNPYTAGLYQINALVPSGLQAGDSIPVVVSAGGIQSNPTGISIASGRSASVATFVEMGPSGVVARSVTSQNTCPSITIDGASQAMQTRAAPTLPFYPVLTCETAIPAGASSVSIEGRPLLLPVANPTRITALGDTGCRMDASASQACNDAKAWPVVQLAQNAAATNPQLLIHNGDYHYREVQCMNAGCAGSPWGFNWDVWREDFFKPFGTLLSTAPWVFVRGNHESCDRAGEGWFRFLDPRPMPAACQVYTDPYSIDIGPVQLIHLDSASADDTTTPAPDPAIVAAYVPQFNQIGQLAGSNAWIITHRPIWAIRSNANSNVVLQAASQNILPDGVQLVLSGHTHTFQTYTFSPARAPQLVIGNSGDNLAANPSVPLVGAVLGNATVTKGTSLAGFGFSTLTPTTGGGWTIVAIDAAGNTVDTCTFQSPVITCDK